MGGSAVEQPVPRLSYVLVFECEMCRRDVYAHFHTEEPELDLRLTCPCGWGGTRCGTQAMKVLRQVADSQPPKL